MFVTLGGIILGLVARYSLPRRSTHGALLVPAVGGAAAAIVWVASTWAGLAWDGGIIWIISLVLAGVAAFVVALVLGRSREAKDAERLQGMLNGSIPIPH